MDRALRSVIRAQLVAAIAALDAADAAEAVGGAASSGTVTLDEHIRRTGQNKRKAREMFNAFERAGFRVVRLGRALSMDASEYARAVEALASKRHVRPRAASCSADELLDAVGAVPVRRQRRAA